jgi:hypothetical protein
MEHGFIVEVSNDTDFPQVLYLFKDAGLPSGISVKVINSNLDYDFLLIVAKKKGFIGTGVIVDNKDLKCVTVFDGLNTETICFDKLILQKQILIDGINRYMSLVIPGKSEAPILIQLVP